MPYNLSQTIKTLSFFLGVIVISLSLSYLVSAWTEPTAAPPAGNVSTPLNIGSTGQSKQGGLILNTGGAPNGLIVQSGNVGIGTASPSPGAKLEVAGQVKITGGSPGAGKVLTSDASGLAIWGAGGGSVPSGAVMFFNLTSCPTGWTELTTARGRYLVGLPLSGTLSGAAGTALTDMENRPVGQHNHSLIDPGHTHTGGGTVQSPPNAPWQYGGALVSSNTGSSITGITIVNSGTVAGTNAPYLQLLVCQKD